MSDVSTLKGQHLLSTSVRTPLPGSNWDSIYASKWEIEERKDTSSTFSDLVCHLLYKMINTPIQNDEYSCPRYADRPVQISRRHFPYRCRYESKQFLRDVLTRSDILMSTEADDHAPMATAAVIEDDFEQPKEWQRFYMGYR